RRFFFFSSRTRHTTWPRDWSSDVCSSDLCFAAALSAQVFAAFRAGDREGAGKLQERLAPLDREVVGKLGPAGVKAAMDAVGGGRSEERRVGKEGRSRWPTYDGKNK